MLDRMRKKAPEPLDKLDEVEAKDTEPDLIDRCQEMIQSLSDFEKKQVAERWVGTIVKGIPDTLLAKVQEGDTTAVCWLEGHLREVITPKIIALVEGQRDRDRAPRGFSVQATSEELDQRIAEIEYPATDMPLENRLGAIQGAATPTAVPPVGVKMFMDQ